MGALAVAVIALAALLSGCETQFPSVRLRVAAGNQQGVYSLMGTYLAGAWQARLGTEQPEVMITGGSPDNMGRLLGGQADIAFSAADVAAEPTGGKTQPRALARIYDDYLHVVVHDDGRIQTLSDLRGMRVAIGQRNSGVEFIAKRVLAVVGLDKPGMVSTESMELTTATEKFKRGELDAFFWSGGLPTDAISTLANSTTIRLLDLGDDLPKLRTRYPVYNAATIPSSTYHLSGPSVNTLAVPNFLLVTSDMSDDLAEALVREFFADVPALAKVTPAALSIDIQSAIETDPIPLHPGAARYYRSEKV